MQASWRVADHEYADRETQKAAEPLPRTSESGLIFSTYVHRESGSGFEITEYE